MRMRSFTDFSLNAGILKAIDEAGYTEPTPIQAQALPVALEGRDILGIAQTGTGKTASFLLPIINTLITGRARARMPRALILTPTRELATQISENFNIYTKYLSLTQALIIGGVNFKQQNINIKRNIDVLIATPGRFLDHCQRGNLLLTDIQIVTLDEADRMLDMGFIDDIEQIFKRTSQARQRFFFSATMAPELAKLTQKFLRNPQRVEVAPEGNILKTISQSIFIHTPKKIRQAQQEKIDILCKFIKQEGTNCTNAIIFCNRKTQVDKVTQTLQAKGFSIQAIHGNLPQSKRMEVLDGFRENKIRFLCASDVAARGLDIPNVSHVFNFDIPLNPEDYVHRIGRTGRAGRAGKTLTIMIDDEQKKLNAIETLIKEKIPIVEIMPPESLVTTTKTDLHKKNILDEKSSHAKQMKPRQRSPRMPTQKQAHKDSNNVLPPFLTCSLEERTKK